jgi:hypothetical protein
MTDQKDRHMPKQQWKEVLQASTDVYLGVFLFTELQTPLQNLYYSHSKS